MAATAKVLEEVTRTSTGPACHEAPSVVAVDERSFRFQLDEALPFRWTNGRRGEAAQTATRKALEPEPGE